jgi:hypothetical protein
MAPCLWELSGGPLALLITTGTLSRDEGGLLNEQMHLGEPGPASASLWSPLYTFYLSKYFFGGTGV